MHHVEARSGFPGLVRLQMADQVPPNRQVGCPIHLVQRFLKFVFSEIDLPAVGDGPDVVGGEGFRDGDESNGRGVASGPASRSRDSIADVGQPGAKRGGIDHAPLGGYGSLLRQLRGERLRLSRVRSVGRELDVRVKFRARALEIAFVHQSHPELVVCLGVIGLCRNRLLERRLGFGNLSSVPEHDALVVSRIRADGATRGRRRQLSRLLRGFLSQVELPLGGINARETVVRVGRRFDFNRLLVRFLRLVVILLANVRDADVVVAVGALRVGFQRIVELGDRLVEIAGGARRDTFVEGLVQAFAGRRESEKSQLVNILLPARRRVRPLVT